MDGIIKALEFFAVFSLAIEMGFETVFSLPFVESYFKKDKRRAYIKRLVILTFCLILCSVLYSVTEATQGALFLERLFEKKIPVVDVVFTALILTSGSRAIHGVLKKIGGSPTPEESEKTS